MMPSTNTVYATSHGDCVATETMNTASIYDSIIFISCTHTENCIYFIIYHQGLIITHNKYKINIKHEKKIFIKFTEHGVGL